MVIFSNGDSMKITNNTTETKVELAFVVPVRHFTKASVSRRATLR